MHHNGVNQCKVTISLDCFFFDNFQDINMKFCIHMQNYLRHKNNCQRS
jgi:hypothetical protein